jgi:hypothetical protein
VDNSPKMCKSPHTVLDVFHPAKLSTKNGDNLSTLST